MKSFVKPYTFEDEAIDYLTLIIGDIIEGNALRRLTVKIGKWPRAGYCPTKEDFDKSSSHNILTGQSFIELPIIKNMSREFFEKLKMFAAHEAGHIAYTYPHPILNIAQKNAHDKKKWLDLNVMNAFEDIRIEHELERKRMQESSLKRLLPMTFKNFRKLAYGQMGTTQALSDSDSDEKKKFDRAYQIFGKLVLKSQLDLIGYGHIINDDEIREAYTKHFAPIISANKNIRYDEPNWTLKISKEFLDKFREVFPEQAADLDKHQDQASPGQGQKTQPSQGDGDGKTGSSGKGEGKKGKPYNGELQNTSSYSGEDIGPLQGKDTEEKMNKNVKGNGAGGGNISYRKSEKRQITPAAISKTLREYGNAVSAFNRLFCGGWRAPSHQIYTEAEEGEIDPEFLYKGKFGGRDRSIYQDSRKAIAEGLSVLCLFDNSGSMSSEQMSKILDASIIIDKASAIKNNIHTRIVYFTNESVEVRDYEDKAANFEDLGSLMRNQGGTPTGEALTIELPKLLSRKGSKFLVVATDGQPNDVQQTRNVLQRYRDYGVKILYIELCGGNRSSFKDCVDYYIEYDQSKMKNMAIHLSKDVLTAVKDHAKKSLRGVA